MKFNKILFFTIITAFLITAALPAQAAIIPPCATGSSVPQLSCFLELAVSVSKWILGITGSLALLFFVYGGFLFLTSSGKEQQITKGKTILTQAAIGIIIIFGAYIGVSFLTTAIGGKFTTEFKIDQPITPAPKCAYCYCKDSSGKEIPSGAGTTIDACKTTCSQAQIAGQGGFSFSKCSSPPSGQTPTTPGSVSACLCICSNDYQEYITGGQQSYSASSQCTSICAMKKSTVQSCNAKNCDCVCEDTSGTQEYAEGVKSSESECKQACISKSRIFGSCNMSATQ